MRKVKENSGKNKELDVFISQLERLLSPSELDVEQILAQTKDDFQKFVKSFGFNSD